jgi:hypothetical protein
LGERVARDGVFTSRRGPGEGVRDRHFHGCDGFPMVAFQVHRLTINCRDPSLRSG